MNSWMLVGGGALVGFLSSFVSYVRAAWSYLSSYVVVNVELNGILPHALLAYCMDFGTAHKIGPRVYSGWLTYVRPRRKKEAIGFETLGRSSKLFWFGWRPLWMTRVSASGSEHDQSAIIDRPITLTFIRGTFDSDELMIQSLDHYNTTSPHGGESRHHIRYITGSAGKPIVVKEEGESPVGNMSAKEEDLRGLRLLHWSHDDIGPARPVCRALDSLALESDAQQLIDDIFAWRENQHWYEERDIPWRMGIRLDGPPGCGKTALVRALAEDLDFPVYSYDLATLYNAEMKRVWSDMLTETPCIALIEDIDNVFDGRDTKVDLTFDCLLNCLDGVERTNGLLVFVTTNRPETLDVALSGQSDGDMCTRPGRIDRSLRLGTLSESGRVKLAARILRDWPDLQVQIVSDGDGDTGAQFQYRCVRAARRIVHRDPVEV